MRRRILPLLATTAAAVLVAGLAPATAAPVTPAALAAPGTLPDSSAFGSYFPQSPTRLLDTRAGGGAALGPGGSVTVIPAAVAGVVPNAVVVNLTAVTPTTAGYLTAYPSQTTRPLASSVNFAAGRTTANLVTVKVGADGKFVVTNGFGAAHVVVDQLGVYTGASTVAGGRGGGYQPLLDGPQRTLDTRSDGGGPLVGGYYIEVPFRYSGTDTGAPIAAVAVNVTVTNARAASGFITTWDAATNVPPKASTLNFTAGQTVANSAIVPTSQSGQDAVIGIYNGSGGPVDLVVDIVGFFDNGSLAAPIRFEPLAAPVRIVDSRSKLGLSPLGPGGLGAFTAPSSVLGSTAGPTVGLDANLTLVAPTAPSYLTLWPKTGDLRKPSTSNVNAPTGQVVANHVIQELGSTNAVNIFNYAGTANVVVDVGGRFVRIDGQAGAGAQAATGSRLTVGTPTVQRVGA